MKRVFVVHGLGYGDEGKGTTTHYLSSKYKAHTVIRTGGPQAFHRVVTAKGAEHVHSQFGSGTLCGAATHLSEHMVIYPDAILNEAQALKYEHGIPDIFEHLTIHENALVITPAHAIANRLHEIARGANRHGTVGIGVGEAVLDADVHEDLIIRAGDLGKPYLTEKVEAIRQCKLRDLAKLIDNVDTLPENARSQARAEIAVLSDTQVVKWFVDKSHDVAKRVKIVNSGYVAEKVFDKEGVVVFEGSQGVLLDRWYGFHPHTTKVRTVPDTALSLIREYKYTGEVRTLGVLRAYATRHGAGPFVSESKELTEHLPDAYNAEHPWQGNFRVGHFDVVAAKYAIDACGGPQALDGLVITCVDRILDLGIWNICDTYIGPYAPNFFSYNRCGSINGINVQHNTCDAQLAQKEELCNLLQKCQPNLDTFTIRSLCVKDFASLCAEILRYRLNVPVVVASIGPTERDKIIIKTTKQSL